MRCLHKLPARTSETENGLFWFCIQKPTCNFICSEDEGYLYEMGIIAFERTKQPQPYCCGNNPAKLRVVKDITKQNYGRPFFVCPKETERCEYFGWGDETILPKPYCFSQRKTQKLDSEKRRSKHREKISQISPKARRHQKTQISPMGYRKGRRRQRHGKPTPKKTSRKTHPKPKRGPKKHFEQIQ